MRTLSYLWPLPCTLLGLTIGFMPFLGKRTIVFRRGTIGVYGPGIARLLSCVPIQGGAAAITFGHTLLAMDEVRYEETFEHEWIHVRQYMWWGPFFLPAYALNSLWHWLCGGDGYLDNSFEIQARKLTEPSQSGA